MPNEPFRIALNMAGAVSAGAYTAGVLDFLVEALDTWYEARQNDAGIPRHDVRLEALTGASAGGMCAAISAVALKEGFVHVHESEPAGDVNRLYKSWVQTIDIIPLLETRDLDADPVVHSILDCTPIEEIAAMALKAEPARKKDRAWVSENLHLILTISNLRGIPYSVDRGGNNFEERIGYHADQVEFVVSANGAPDGDIALPLAYPPADGAENWKALQTAAMATGAFPVALRARIVQKTGAYYESKKWHVSNESPKDGSCSDLECIKPAWGKAPDAFPIVCSDGGLTNNNPFDCAHDLLVRAANAKCHLPRDPKEAIGSVISVAPFPGDEPFNPDYKAEREASLLNVLGSLIPTLISQSRFQGENLLLTEDPNVSSRFAIAPSDDTAPDKPALLCGALSAFGGFIHQAFRDRDYHLGRRNCQQFLRVHFCLPESNPLIAAGLPADAKAREKWALDPPDGVQSNERWFPVVPLVGDVAKEVVAPPREEAKTSEEHVDQVADKASERLRRVANALLDGPENPHPLWGFALNALSPVLEHRLKSYIREKVSTELRRTGQL